MRDFLLAAALLAAVGAASGASRAGAVGQTPRVGGFKPVAADNPEVTAAARFAAAAEGKKENTHIRLLSVESAEQAVVAGVIYRLCLKVEIEDAENNVDVTTNIRTEVFKSLQKQYQLRNWNEEDCGGGDDDN